MTRPTEHSNARPASWQRKEEFSLAFERKQESRATAEIARSSVSLTCTVGSHTRIRRQSHSMVPSWYAYGITRSVYVNLRTRARARVRWEWPVAARQCRSRARTWRSHRFAISDDIGDCGRARYREQIDRRKILWLLPHEAGDSPRFRLVLDYCQTAEPI